MSDPKGLGWDRDINPSLYDLYAKKLPWRGWAGQRSPEEKAYIKRVKAMDGKTARGGLFTSGGWQRMEYKAVTSPLINSGIAAHKIEAR